MSDIVCYDEVSELPYELVGYKGSQGEVGVTHGSYIPTFSTERSSFYNDFMESYRREHACCPKCGSTGGIQTLVAYTLIQGRELDYKDLNQVRCKCGSVHTVHEQRGI